MLHAIPSASPGRRGRSLRQPLLHHYELAAIANYLKRCKQRLQLAVHLQQQRVAVRAPRDLDTTDLAAIEVTNGTKPLLSPGDRCRQLLTILEQDDWLVV
jgi:hypothetical protein